MCYGLCTICLTVSQEEYCFKCRRIEIYRDVITKLVIDEELFEDELKIFLEENGVVIEWE